jgi:predicted Fe-S protein YdhL (DUF1289 family)
MNRPTPCATHTARRTQAGCLECRRYNRERYHWRKTPEGAAGAYYSIALVRAHIQGLRAEGMRLCDIAAAAGYKTSRLSTLMYDKNRKYCMVRVARRILSVTATATDRWLMDGVGTRRRIRALMCEGWTQGALADRLGYHHSVLWEWTHAAQVHRSSYVRVKALYDELAPLDGGSSWVRRLAERRGWDPPEAWSETSIDDPTAEPYDWSRDDVAGPDRVALEQFEQGVRRWDALTDAEQREVVRRHAGGLSTSTLAKRWKAGRARIERLVAEVFADRQVAA